MNKFSNSTTLHVHLCGFQITHGLKQWTQCQRTCYHKNTNYSGYLTMWHMHHLLVKLCKIFDSPKHSIIFTLIHVQMCFQNYYFIFYVKIVSFPYMYSPAPLHGQDVTQGQFLSGYPLYHGHLQNPTSFFFMVLLVGLLFGFYGISIFVGWFVVWVLWHINLRRLFNAKSMFMKIVLFPTIQFRISTQFKCKYSLIGENISISSYSV